MIKYQLTRTSQPRASWIAQTSEVGPTKRLVPVSIIASHPPLHAIAPNYPKAILKYTCWMKNFLSYTLNFIICCVNYFGCCRP